MARKKLEVVDNFVTDLLTDLSDIEGLTFNDEIKITPLKLDGLNTIMGGGLPIGKFVLVVGLAGAGKSTICGEIIGSVQATDPRSVGVYIDAEQAMGMERLATLGCDKDRTILISQELTLEKLMEIVKKIVAFKINKKLEDVPFVVVLDSESATQPAKAKTVEDHTKIVGLKSNFLSWMVPILVELGNKYNITFIFIGQLRDKIQMNMYQASAGDLKGLGDKKITGGNTMRYMPFQILFLKPKEDIDPTVYGFSGVVSEAMFIKNKLFTPFVKTHVVLDYMKGYSDFWSKVFLLQSCKAIKGTAWQYLENAPELKFRKKQMETMYTTDSIFKEKFDELYKIYKEKSLAFPGALKVINEEETDDDIIEGKEDNAIDEVLNNLE